MARYDVRNVCNYGVLVGLICTALLTSINTFANQPAKWVYIGTRSFSCGFKKEGDLAACKQDAEKSMQIAVADSPYNYYTNAGEPYDIQSIWDGYKFAAMVPYDRWVLANSENAENCQANEHPVYPSTRCDSPPRCEDADIQKEFQNAQYACQISNPNTQLWQTNFEWSCSNVVGSQPNIRAHCNYEPTNCIVGLTCEKAEKDIAYCDPTKEQCELPPQSEHLEPAPIPELPPLDGSKNGAGNGSTGTGANVPTENPNFCDLNPQLCEKQQPPEPTPEPNPTPTEKPDNTELSAGDNAIVGEVSLSNQHLENVNSNLKSLGGQLLEQLSRGNEFSQHQLGLMREMLEHLIQGDNSALIPNETSKEEKPKEEEQEKTDPPMANADCDQSIFECRGDVIQCALLKVQYEDTCTVAEFAQLEEAFKGIKLLNNEALIVQNETVDYSRMNKKYLSNGVSFGSGACPAPERISFRAFGDSKTIEFKFDPACRYAELLRPLLIAFAWLTGLFIIGRTQGAV